MTEHEDLAELATRFQARLNGIAMAALGRDERPRIPGETVEQLAKVAVEWAKQQGLVD